MLTLEQFSLNHYNDLHYTGKVNGLKNSHKQ